MAKNTNEIEKIIVQENDELIEIIRKISSSDAGRIILTFTEHSDLLISPINLKVIQELCDEKDKILITQIIQNRTGVLNAETAGIITTDSSAIEDNLWIDALTEQKARKKELRESLKKSNKDEIINEILEEEASEDTSLEEKDKPLRDKTTKKQESVDIEMNGYPTTDDIQSKSIDFKSRINNTLAKSKEEIRAGKNKLVKDGDFVVALDSDISEVSTKSKTETIPSTFIGKSIKPSTLNSYKKMNLFSKQLPNLEEQTPEEIKPVDRQEERKPKKARNVIFFILKLFIPFLIIVALAGYLMYTMLPVAKINLYIESKSISSSITFTGQNSSEFNLENKIIAVKTEEVVKERADNAQTTGLAYRGDRSLGTVQIVCNLTYPTPLSLVSGTVLNHDGMNYYTQAAINETCPWNGSVTVQAEDIGEEYDLPSGNQFTVAGYSLAEVSGNNGSEITGGSKTSYKALSAEDVTNAVNKLKQVTFDEATKELKSSKAGEGWVIIDSSIVNEIDGEPKTDYIIGTETDIFNVSIKTKSRAIYYYRKDLDNIKEDVLVDSAKSQNLFSDAEGYKLKLSEDITTNITVVSLDNGIVTIQYDLSGSVKPDIDKDLIINNLLGKKWDEGKTYLNSLEFTTKNPKTTFIPEYFPEFLWYYPNSSSKIIINIEEEKASTSTTPIIQ